MTNETKPLNYFNHFIFHSTNIKQYNNLIITKVNLALAGMAQWIERQPTN